MADKKPNETFVGKLEVRSMDAEKEGAKSLAVTFRTVDKIEGFEGEKPKIYASKDIWETSDFPDDKQGEATFEKVWNNDGKTFTFFLQKWNGKEKAAYQPKGQGGRTGGGGYVKTKEEIHATALSGIIKGACEMCGNLGINESSSIEKLIKVPVEIYMNSIKVLGGGDS
ncbi:MAG TPA: hypothetical protein VK171_05450 [Fimbriimonas sp.]|nr:hypothetical protein [Fimbriimonas sp.]